jgi:hypothetical protein
MVAGHEPATKEWFEKVEAFLGLRTLDTIRYAGVRTGNHVAQLLATLE